MPKIYLQEFFDSDGSRCRYCRGWAASKLCAKHLRKAKLKFRAWTARRRARGLCCFCQERADKIREPGERPRTGVRCWKHRAINAERCRRWMAEHAQAFYLSCKEAGVCAKRGCGREVVRPHVYCNACLKKMRVAKKK
jgi:hypothetical protein